MLKRSALVALSLWAFSFDMSIAMQVSKFAAKDFVKRCMQSPRQPSSVLSFFYGVDCHGTDGQNKLREGSCIQPMASLWYLGGPEYDKLCAPFAPVVREAGRGELVGDEWEGTVDGVVAQLVLCDQLSRNAFRGTSEAFEYDETALKHARVLTDKVLDLPQQKPLSGEVCPPYLASIVTALMHSEAKDDHGNAISLLNHAKETTSEELEGWWDGQIKFEIDHKQVIDQFGRYPHRNLAKGRENTKEEEAWLADVDNLPGWAKSQLPLSK
jgi:uncharacterized protein (DUF924 family)